MNHHLVNRKRVFGFNLAMVFIVVATLVLGSTLGVGEAAQRNDTSVSSLSRVQQNDKTTLLGCQKNNPNRVDCSSLEVKAVCRADDGVAIFTITNTGEPGDGDMRAATEWRIVDENGNILASGPILLKGGESMTVEWAGGGTVTLYADQQIGHPGSSHPQSTLSCVPSTTETPTEQPTDVPTDTPTETPTDVPTETPTDVPTELPTETPVPPLLDAIGICSLELPGTYFIIWNLGGAMTEPASYTVYDENGDVVTFGAFLLGAAGSPDDYIQIDTNSTGTQTLHVEYNGIALDYTASCEPTVTETPTETPPQDPYLELDSKCSYQDGMLGTYLYIYNFGGAMTETGIYTVTDEFGNVLEQDWFQFDAYGSGFTAIEIFLPDVFGPVTLTVDYQAVTYTITPSCSLVTETPTPEPTDTPTETPTVEPTDTPTETPTVEPTNTPTVEPSETPTPEPTGTVVYGCQKNNPDRLDCSSLNVTALCTADGTAVFTISNTGVPGEGDMVQSTPWWIIDANGNLLDSGFVLLDGSTSMTVEWTQGGQVTLYANQQIGHPGNSDPQATIDCTK